MNNKLSVIVPVYNTEVYLRRCVESILKQSYANIEIVLVDDGSTDGSGELCDILAKEDVRIKVIHKRNGGQLNARREGVLFASGEYITCVDSDDWIDSSRFQAAMNNIQLYEVDACYLSGYVREYDDRSVVFCEKIGEKRYDRDDIRTEFMKLLAGSNVFFDRKVFLAHWMIFVRKELYMRSIMGIDDRIRRAEDTVSILTCILKCDSLYFGESTTYHYLQEREGSVGKRKKDWAKEHARIYYKQLQKLREEQDLVTREMKNVFTQFAYHNLFLTNYKILYNYYKEYLFPYTSVKNGSRIVVYGAGNVGVEIENAVMSDERFEVVAWVDKNVKNNPRSEYEVKPIETIKKLEFDYVVITIISPSIADSIKKELVSTGIIENKITMMVCTEMSQDDLANMFGSIKQ